MKKEHLLFKNPQEGVTDFKQKSRYNPNSTENEEEMEDIVKDYTPKKEDFERSYLTWADTQKEKPLIILIGYF